MKVTAHPERHNASSPLACPSVTAADPWPWLLADPASPSGLVNRCVIPLVCAASEKRVEGIVNLLSIPDASGVLRKYTYHRIWDICLEEVYTDHQDLLNCFAGVADFNSFKAIADELICRCIDSRLAELLKTRDLADIVEQEESRIIDHPDGTPDRKQAEWDLVVGAYTDKLLLSKRWGEQIRNLIGILRKKGRLLEDDEMSDEAAYWTLWGEVLLGAVEKTGAARTRQDGAPRRLRHIVGFGHLTHRLEGEFRDDATIKGQKADGQEGEVRRVSGKIDPQDVSGNPAGPEDQLATEIDADRILDYVEQRSAALGRTLEMWMEESTQAEISRDLQIDQGTVSRDLKLLFQNLRDEFGDN